MTLSGAARSRDFAVRVGDLPVRFLSGILLATIAIGGAWLGGIAAALAAAVAGMIVHLEWTGLTERRGERALPFTLLVGIATVVAGAGHITTGLGIAAIAAAIGAATSRDPWRPAGMVYSALLGISLLALRLAPELGLASVVYLFAVVTLTDTGALFAGRAIGGAKLWPSVSPNKTWAGAVGGIVGAILAGLLFAVVANLPITPRFLFVTVVLGLACEAGDLFESFVKRRFGAKDSGNLIPGHGGLMDRVDGLVFASVVAAFIGWLHGGADDIARGLLLW